MTQTNESTRLVLTRKRGEAIVINGNIVVRVAQPGPSQVRLVIEAPRDVVVLREELAHEPT